MLVIQKAGDEDTTAEKQKAIELAIKNNNTAVKKSYQHKSGDLMIECESEDQLSELKNIMTTNNNEIMVNTHREAYRHSITLVGLQKRVRKRRNCGYVGYAKWIYS